jgi:hypothetical protein
MLDVTAVRFVSSDPSAWMRPYYEEVASREGFARSSLASVRAVPLVNR